MAKFRCVRTCTGTARKTDGTVIMEKTHHEGELRPVIQVWVEDELYEFDTVEQMPIKVAPVPKLDEDGQFIFQDDPRKKNQPYADLVMVYDVDVDPNSGKRTIKRDSQGYNHFERLNANGEPIPMDEDEMLHAYFVRERVRQRRRELAQQAIGVKRQDARERARERAEQIEAEADALMKGQGDGLSEEEALAMAAVE